MQGISVSNKRIEAEVLHNKILQYGQTASESLYYMCQCIKKMHDEKLYIELGFKEFGEYTKAKLNIEQRQAYNYISALEKWGDKGFKEHAELGITKLSLLASAPVIERQEIIENNDLPNMTAAEVKELVDKYKKQGEQLSLLNTELENKNNELSEVNSDNEALREKLKEAENKPTEVAVEEISTEKLAEIEANAKLQAVKQLKAEHEKEIKKAEKKAALAAKAEVTEKLKMLEAEKVENIEKLQRLEKQLQVSANPDITKFMFLFEEMQNTTNSIIEIVDHLEPKSKTKLKTIVKQYVSTLNEWVNKE